MVRLKCATSSKIDTIGYIPIVGNLLGIGRIIYGLGKAGICAAAEARYARKPKKKYKWSQGKKDGLKSSLRGVYEFLPGTALACLMPHDHQYKYYRTGKHRYEMKHHNIVYEGRFSNGEPHGKGKMRWKDGTEYEGMWYKGLPCGQGKWSNLNGDVYVGGWHRGQRHGYGHMEYADGRKFTGMWRYNRPCLWMVI